MKNGIFATLLNRKEIMTFLITIIVLGTSIWVLADASQRKLGKGEYPIVWFIGCLLLWIIIFPLYIAKRSKYPLK